MNENINLIDILKDAPKGTKLWSPIFGECEFIKILPVNICQIQVKHTEGNTYHFYNFTSQGKFSNNSEAECLLFPSKEYRDWSTFKAPWKHKHFEPFQKVLIKRYRLTGPAIWGASYYSHYVNNAHYTTTGKAVGDEDIISYRGNEDKLGKPVEK